MNRKIIVTVIKLTLSVQRKYQFRVSLSPKKWLKNVFLYEGRCVDPSEAQNLTDIYCSNLHKSYILEQRTWSKSYFEVFNKSNSIFAKNHKFVPADLVSIVQKPDFRPPLTSKSGSKCILSHYNEHVDIGTIEIGVRSVWGWAELKSCVLRHDVVLGTNVSQNPDRIRWTLYTLS